MEPIKAFVAHSFTEEDEGVVSVVLKCLDRVVALHPRFSWEHAENPEPSMVDAKVLSLISDKNLFIGICTRKEQVVSPIALTSNWFSRDTFRGKKSDFHWKTSDWIIQEIGLAIGRGMKIIILLEENTKSPGALQGNLEYIGFSRNAPEKCFDKLLGMIASLSPHSSSTSSTTQEATPQGDQDTEPQQPNTDNRWTSPQPDWKTPDFQLALLWHILKKNKPEEEQITKLYYASTEGSDAEKRKEWDAHQEMLHITHGSGGNLEKLERYSTDFPMNSPIAADLASGYLHYQEYEKAANTYLLAADACKDEIRQISLIADAALNYLKAGIPHRVRELETRMILLSEKIGQGEAIVLQAKRELAEQEKDVESTLAVLERLIEINPGDIDTRFSLAYKYSETGRDNLAAFHYSRIPPAERKAYAWNNLGVSLERLALPIKSVAAYKKSEALGETLAMSNLAIRLRDAGFCESALSTIHAALKIEDHHKNVESTLTSISDAQAAEDKKEIETYEKAKPISEFYRQFGRSLIRTMAVNIVGKWKSPNCTLEFTVEGAIVIATGSYEALGLGAFANPYAKGNPEPSQYTVEYNGAIQGMTIIGSVQRKKKDDASKMITILGSSESNSSVLMWVTQTGDKIHVLERNAKNEPRQYEFTRI